VKKLKWILFSLATTFSSLSLSYDKLEHVYANLLISQSSDQVKVAANYLYNVPARSPEILDLTAAVLFQEQKSTHINDDTLAWLAKVLGDSKNYRYSELLLKSSKNSKFPKLRKHSKQALKNLTKSDAELFNGTGFDFSVVKTELKNSATPVNKEAFRRFYVGDTGNRVLSEAGTPNRIVVDYVSKHQAWVGRVSHPHIALVYTDLGKIRLDHPGEKGTHVVIGRIDLAHQSSSDDYIASLAETDPSRIRDTAKRMYRAYVDDPEAMELSIKYINENMSKKDKLTVDAMAWLCKVVGQSGASNYYSQLIHISKNAKSGKLKKYAKKSAALLPH
jgi:hypothetical protein